MILYWLCYYSCLKFSPFAPLHPSLRQSSHNCSCPWVMHISPLPAPLPVLYFTSPRLFFNYLFVLLNPLTSSPVSSIPLVPNIFGTRDQFHGRQFFHALGCGGGGQEAELWPGREVGDRRQSSAFKAALFMAMGHVYKFFGYSISYSVLYIPMAIL